MKHVVLGLIVFSFMAMVFACGSQGGGLTGGDSPTEAYKRLYAAVKSKDTEAIKKQMTKKTIDFAGMASQRNNTPIEKVFENGFTATTFADSLPTIRDERVKDDMGNVEVWNSKDSRWEDLPFINEDGTWKLAIGDLFAGSFKSPGRGRDSLEKEAANALNSNNMVPAVPTNANTMANANTPPTIIQPKPEVKAK